MSLQTFGSGSKVVFDYDTRGRTNWISHQNASSVEQQRFSYTYDDNGNVLTYRDNIIGGNNWLTTYTYDYANRLESDVRTGGASFNYNNAYSYDKNGNRTSVTRNGTPSTYTVDDNDKLLSGDGFTLSSYSADGAPGLVFVPGTGNLTFSYDYENRMSQVVLPTHTDTFRYNADGLRVERISNQGTQRYVYDGDRIIAVCDGAGTILTWFSPLGESLVTGTTQYYYRQNAIGSNIGVTLSNGTLSSIKEFDAYGIEYTVQSGAWTQFRFVGKHGVDTDTDTGLVHMGHRYYAPKLGRFLTQDPIGHEAGLNLYQYCENNPIIKVDPDGKQSVSTPPGRAALIRELIDAAAREGGHIGRAVFQQVGSSAMLKLVQHHTFPVALGAWFSQRGININQHLMRMPQWLHNYLHRGATQPGLIDKILGRPARGGWWNKEWITFRNSNPNATREEIFRFRDKLIEQVRLADMRIGKESAVRANPFKDGH